MTEDEWADWSGDPDFLLDPVRNTVSGRKLRLFACACCLRIWHMLTDERSRKAVKVGELFADGKVDERELAAAKVAANSAHFEAATPAIFSPAAHAAACAFYTATAPPILTFAAANRAASSLGLEKEAEQKEQASLFRDILGNPFRPVFADTSWLAWNDDTIPKLAQAIYDDRAFDRLPILADALEDAGCDNADILAHCRGPGPHVRGCWVVDLLLGKE
jgi:hypothetical protein